jgi:hypothetical protein
MSGTSDSTPDPSQTPSPSLEELLGRALTDDEFRNRLYDDREQAIKDYKLTASDLAALDNLPRDELENYAQRFAAHGAPALTIMIFVRVKF